MIECLAKQSYPIIRKYSNFFDCRLFIACLIAQPSLTLNQHQDITWLLEIKIWKPKKTIMIKFIGHRIPLIRINYIFSFTLKRKKHAMSTSNRKWLSNNCIEKKPILNDFQERYFLIKGKSVCVCVCASKKGKINTQLFIDQNLHSTTVGIKSIQRREKVAKCYDCFATTAILPFLLPLPSHNASDIPNEMSGKHFWYKWAKEKNDDSSFFHSSIMRCWLRVANAA